MMCGSWKYECDELNEGKMSLGTIRVVVRVGKKCYVICCGIIIIDRR